MAIASITLEVFKQILGTLPSRPLKLVTVGYPDCLVSEEELTNLLGSEVMDKVEFRDDSDAIIKWHSLSGRLKRVVETRSLLSAMGIEMTALDIAQVRGDEIVCDLNEPIPSTLAGQFDIVFDGGTMEHCFNVGQVVVNMASMAKVGGMILHNNPLYAINHGFFNFSPTFYYDFYRDNGHTLVSPIYGYVSDGMTFQTFVLDPLKVMYQAPENSWVLVVVRRDNDSPLQWPVQTRHKGFQSLAEKADSAV